ncbi:hypothetical protein BOX15_Mlig001283g2 [Macrostomum lignano]|uniref:Uncharacterized protein n=1 Tax=Macrostomum lignano TaxID=282301 RepID=A0A267G1J4_9PLAT|nr:hypothetical protein BOX15_Mlig001283g2 [Macrostomum lignano]
MPRGRGPQHKGARRQFTDEDTLAREVQELNVREGGGGRSKKKEESDESDSSEDEAEDAGAAGGSGDEDGEKTKAHGVENLIQSENPNRQPAATKSVKKLGADAPAPSCPAANGRSCSGSEIARPTRGCTPSTRLPRLRRTSPAWLLCAPNARRRPKSAKRSARPRRLRRSAGARKWSAARPAGRPP